MSTEATNVRIINATGLLLKGTDDFSKVKTQQLCFVDKTLLMEELLLRCSDMVCLITRPRRFGKSVNISMLKYFFEKPIGDEDTRHLFDGTLISEQPEIMQHQGKYPVIYMTFKDVKENDWEGALEKLQDTIIDEIERHPESEDLSVLQTSEAERFRQIMQREATLDRWHQSLFLFSKLLTLHHKGVKPWILLDEYDTPMHQAFTRSKQLKQDVHSSDSYYDKMSRFMSGLLGPALKDNPHLHRSVITGILRMAKESIFSGLSNLGVYSVLESQFSEFFGFTQAEVENLFQKRNLQQHVQRAQHWYDGYLFGDTSVYNPWSIVSFMANKTHALKTYWVNTSDNALIHTLVALADANTKDDLLQLLSNNQQGILRHIQEDPPLRNLTGTPKQLWSLLLSAGYATACPPPPGQTQPGPEDGRIWLRLPNQEVRKLYRDFIQEWFAEKSRARLSQGMINALLAGNGQLFEQRLQDFVHTSMSYFSVGGDEPERVYQALMLGMLVQLESTYHIRCERETGEGRADLLLSPRTPGNPGIVLEFKLAERVQFETDNTKINAELQTVAQDALQQIHHKKYMTEVADHAPSFTLAVGIAFARKRLAVRYDQQEGTSH